MKYKLTKAELDMLASSEESEVEPTPKKTQKVVTKKKRTVKVKKTN